jgi:hypothetical protein
MRFANTPPPFDPRPSTPGLPKEPVESRLPRHRRCVPSLRFFPASTVCYGAQAPDILQPGAGPGVRCVVFRRARGSCPLRLAAGRPATRSHPSKVFSCPTAAPHHCGRCPLAVHRCRLDFEALLHRPVRVRRLRFQRHRHPILPWDCAPLRGHDFIAGARSLLRVRSRRRFEPVSSVRLAACTSRTKCRPPWGFSTSKSC